MKYKQDAYTLVIILTAGLKYIAATEQHSRESSDEKFSHGSKLESITSTTNRSSLFSENSINQEYLSLGKASENPDREEFFESQVFTQSFPSQLDNCFKNHQYQIAQNYTEGKSIILNCFKATLILNLMRYVGASPRFSIKLFNGLLEIKKIPDKHCDHSESFNVTKKCKESTSEYLERLMAKSANSQNKKNEYMRLYKKAMERLMNEKTKFQSFKNVTEEDKVNQVNKINEGSQAFLSEVIRSLGDEDAEKAEEENIKRELTDPRLLSVLDALSKNYMLKLKFYPGVSARVKRSHNGGVTFDLEISETPEGLEEDSLSYEGSTREIKDSKSQAKIFIEESEEDQGNKKRKRKGQKDKRKRKESKKKVKKLKKVIPYLLLPILIQMTLLPFVFKKLFFLAMKALFAGKVALILIVFNLLRNTCIHQEDKYAQRIRVEHYGYNKGEEYGAWINGRSAQEPTVMSGLSERPYIQQKPM